MRLKLLRVLALVAPALVLLVVDAVRRAERFASLDRTHRIGYAITVVVSGLVWASALYLACVRRSRLRHVGAFAFVVPYGFAFGVQAAFFARYRIYCSLDAQIDCDSVGWATIGSLPLRDGRLPLHLLVGLVIAGLLLAFARVVVRPRRIPGVLRPVPLVLAAVALALMPVSWHKWQSTSADLIYFHGIGALIRHKLAPPYEHLVRAQRRRQGTVPALEAAPARPRNVLFILQESQRLDVTCVEYVPECQLATRATNGLLPHRIPLLEMRSNATSTHLSLQTLFSGLSPNASKEAMESAPYVWEIARAGGYDVAYWTSQNTIFGNMRFALEGAPFRRSVTGTELDHYADPLSGASDAVLTNRVIAEIGDLREPWFAVVQYSNIHRPRGFDAAHAPFQPTDIESRGRKDTEQRNFYKNVVYLSDLAVGRLVEHVRASEVGKRAVIFYTSDHGESYFEHHQDNDHSGSVFEEEIRVPAFIDAPDEILTPDELTALRRKRRAYVWHIDMAPTLLDLLGLWDAPALAPYRAAMIGHPLTRPELTTAPVPLSNVSWVWEYIVPNYGVMQGPLKVEALEKDDHWRCFDVSRDPRERRDLADGDARCAGLITAADQAYHLLPKDLGRLKRSPNWGDGLTQSP